jgi:hypothetical protein
MNRSAILVVSAYLLLGTVYRIIPYEYREWLGAPQIAMAIFAGAVCKNKWWAFSVPLLSMLLSDLVMQGLHQVNSQYRPGFYQGQWLNYGLILLTTVIGFFVQAKKPVQVFMGGLAGALFFFVFSNFAVWLGGGGWGHPKTWQGLIATYADGLPFLRSSLTGTWLWSALFFGLYTILNKRTPAAASATSKAYVKA